MGFLKNKLGIIASVIATAIICGASLAFGLPPKSGGSADIVTITAGSSNIVVTNGTGPTATVDLGTALSVASVAASGDVSGATLHDTGLTSGQCVQATTGGLLQSSGAGCGAAGGTLSSVTFPAAVFSSSVSSGVETVTMAHGTDFMDLSTTQTATNKTLTSPTLSGGSIQITGNAGFSHAYPDFNFTNAASAGFQSATTGANDAFKLQSTVLGTLTGNLLRMQTTDGSSVLHDMFDVDATGNGTFTGGVTAANVTDSALSNGNCVQAGASGILTTVVGACGSVGITYNSPLVLTTGVLSCVNCVVTTASNTFSNTNQFTGIVQLTGTDSITNGVTINGGSNNLGGTSNNEAIYDHADETFKVLVDNTSGSKSTFVFNAAGTTTGDAYDFQITGANKMFMAQNGQVNFASNSNFNSGFKTLQVGQKSACQWACGGALVAGVYTFTFNTAFTGSAQPVCNPAWDDTQEASVVAGDTLHYKVTGTSGSPPSQIGPWLSVTVTAYTSAGSVDTSNTHHVSVSCSGNPI